MAPGGRIRCRRPRRCKGDAGPRVYGIWRVPRAALFQRQIEVEIGQRGGQVGGDKGKPLGSAAGDSLGIAGKAAQKQALGLAAAAGGADSWERSAEGGVVDDFVGDAEGCTAIDGRDAHELHRNFGRPRRHSHRRKDAPRRWDPDSEIVARRRKPTRNRETRGDPDDEAPSRDETSSGARRRLFRSLRRRRRHFGGPRRRGLRGNRLRRGRRGGERKRAPDAAANAARHQAPRWRQGDPAQIGDCPALGTGMHSPASSFPPPRG